MSKKLWRIFKYILGIFALLCVALVLWWLNMEGIFLSDLKDTKARIAHSPHFINGVAQNFEPNKSSESIVEDAQDSRKSNSKDSLNLGESNENKSQKKFTKLSLLEISSVKIPSIKSDLRELAKQDSFVWFGHSSYMLNLGGQTLLIDPVLKDNAAPLPFVVNTFKGADIYAPSELPAIDFLIITHNHYDHLSKSTIRALAPKIKRAIVPLGVGKYLKAWGISESKITELDWNESAEFDTEFGAFIFHCLTARHYSSRGLLDRDKTLWASFLVEFSADLREFNQKNTQDSRESRHKNSRALQSKKIFIGGDSGYGAHFVEFGKKFGAIDLAFLDNGQFNARWEWIHAFPSQNLQIARELNAKAIMPLHNSKFRLAPHEWSEPLEQIYTLYTQGKYDFALLTPQVGQIVPLWSEKDKKIEFRAWWRQANANLK